jgi:metal-sulfur cluster biosynthetic enzyme
MGPTRTPTAELRIDEPQLRLAENDGRIALDSVIGLDAVRARARLRFGPGRTCEPVARLLDRAILRAERAGLHPQRLIVASGSAQAAEDIVRVRRKAHGTADWISSPTSHVQISLQPAGLHATAGSRPAQARPPAVVTTASPAGGDPADERAEAIRGALLDVIDPDLGVNIVDLGFVRTVEVQDRTAVITMTLTSAACPLTSIMEDQIAAELAALSEVDGFRVDWEWLPPWRPADITDSGRDQLRAIGFSF